MEHFTEHSMGKARFAISDTFADKIRSVRELTPGAFVGQVYMGSVCTEFIAWTDAGELECNIYAISDSHYYGSTTDGRGYDLYFTTYMAMPPVHSTPEATAAYLLGELLIPMVEDGLLPQLGANLDTWRS